MAKWSTTKTLLVGGTAGLVLWFFLRGGFGSSGSGKPAGPSGGVSALTPCYVFLSPDEIRVATTPPASGEWSVSTRPSSVVEIIATCRLVYMRIRGDTTQGRVDNTVAELEAGGVIVMKEPVT